MGTLTVVTGVAGSGKSTLVNRLLSSHYPHAVLVDQRALGGKRRSTIASYMGIVEPIRALFARASGHPASLFSSNGQGACSQCKGLGMIHTDLAFMDSVETSCEACAGSRFNHAARAVDYLGKNIVQTLALSAAQALAHFAEYESIVRLLLRLQRVGLDYAPLGQCLSTLSGGERQRLKLASRLEEAGALHLFDEPTTGLHWANVDRLLALFDGLVDRGDTVIVVEHNLDVIAHAG